MRFMLDTNICIYAIKHKPAAVIQRLLELNPADICISSVTFSELLYGSEKSDFPERNRTAISLFFSPFTILDYDASAASEYGQIRSSLERRGTPIGPLDMLIAAHAKSQNLVLVTHNTKEFARVDGLQVEDWV